MIQILLNAGARVTPRDRQAITNIVRDSEYNVINDIVKLIRPE